MESWHGIAKDGFQLLLFDDGAARTFIRRALGKRYAKAYDACYHPAMRSDYFRLCYVLIEGGCYLDADDIYSGVCIDKYFADGRLSLHPLCFDKSTQQMIPWSTFGRWGAGSSNWIFYFNNNPLIACAGNPIVERALSTATKSLEEKRLDLPEIQSTTGPGNLTRAVFAHALAIGKISDCLHILRDWDSVAVSKWPLSYRSDTRNWRLSNQQRHFYLSSHEEGETRE